MFYVKITLKTIALPVRSQEGGNCLRTGVMTVSQLQTPYRVGTAATLAVSRELSSGSHWLLTPSWGALETQQAMRYIGTIVN